MEAKYCKNCAYFVQHYCKIKRKYLPVVWGHCIEPRIKPRYEETPACERWRPCGGGVTK